MLKKAITYEDFDGNTVTKEFYFNLSKAELTEWELTTPGGLKAALEKVVADENGEEIVRYFKKIVLDSYGKKSADGQLFVKNDELRREFQYSPAYSELFMSLVTDSAAAAEFINGIVPTKLGEEIARLIDAASAPTGIEKVVGDMKIKPTPEEMTAHEEAKTHVPTRKELLEMSPDEFAAYRSSGSSIL